MGYNFILRILITFWGDINRLYRLKVQEVKAYGKRNGRIEIGV